MPKSFLIIGVFSLAFIILAFYVKTSPYFLWDVSISTAIQSIQNPLFDFFMILLSTLGYFPEVLVLIAIAVGGLYYLKQKREAWTLVFSTVAGVLLSEVFKRIVMRVRPDGSLVRQIGIYLSNDSFPSGHVMFYISFFGFLLFLVYTKLPQGPLKTLLQVILCLLIFFISISRIYLGAHWFTDVLGSYLLGTAWITFVIFIYYRLPEKFNWRIINS